MKVTSGHLCQLLCFLIVLLNFQGNTGKTQEDGKKRPNSTSLLSDRSEIQGDDSLRIRRYFRPGNDLTSNKSITAITFFGEKRQVAIIPGSKGELLCWEFASTCPTVVDSAPSIWPFQDGFFSDDGKLAVYFNPFRGKLRIIRNTQGNWACDDLSPPPLATICAISRHGQYISFVEDTTRAFTTPPGPVEKYRVSIIEVQGGRRLANSNEFDGAAVALRLLPGGKSVAVGIIAPKPHIYLLQLSTGRKAFPFRDASINPKVFAVSLTGDVIVAPPLDPRGGTSVRSTSVLVHETHTGCQLGRIELGSGVLASIALSANGRLLATSDNKSNIAVYDLATWRLIGKRKVGTARITSIAFSRDCRLLALGSADGAVAILAVSLAVDQAVTARLTSDQLAAACAMLGELQVDKLLPAVSTLVSAGDCSVVALDRFLRQQAAVADVSFNHLIADLDHDSFRTRERAMEKLSLSGEQAQPAIQAAMKGKSSAESNRRLTELYSKCIWAGIQPNDLAARRAFRVLELIGTTDAMITHKNAAALFKGKVGFQDLVGAFE